MTYRFQVCLDKGTKTERWADVHPVGGKPYEYATRKEADNAAYVCYGNDHTIVRVVEVDSTPVGPAPTPVYDAEGWEEF